MCRRGGRDGAFGKGGVGGCVITEGCALLRGFVAGVSLEDGHCTSRCFGYCGFLIHLVKQRFEID